MKIFEQLFGTPEIPLNNAPLSVGHANLITEWFKESNLSMAAFEKNFFEPIIEACKMDVYRKQHFENNSQEAYPVYYKILAMRYLIYHNPQNKFLWWLLQIEQQSNYNMKYSQKLSGHNLSRTIYYTQNIAGVLVELYDILQNKKEMVSKIALKLTAYKFHENLDYLDKILAYIHPQSFEDKLFVYFYLKTYKSYPDKTQLSAHQDKINQYFAAVLEQSHTEYDFSLTIESFELLEQVLDLHDALPKTNPRSKKILLPAAWLPLLDAIKTQTKDFLEVTIFYFQKNAFGFEVNINYWENILKQIIDKYEPNEKWFKKYLTRSFENGDTIIFRNILTPLFQNVHQKLAFGDEIVFLYEQALYSRARQGYHYHPPYPRGVELLQNIVQNIKQKAEKNFQLSRLNECYAVSETFREISLEVDKKNKSYFVEKSLIADLNLLLPVALKKIQYIVFEYYSEGDMVLLNYEGQDMRLNLNNFVSYLNQLLFQQKKAYRLVPIPLSVCPPNYNGSIHILCSLTYMSWQEFEFFKNNYFKKFVNNRNSRSAYVETDSMLFNLDTLVQWGSISEKEINSLPFLALKDASLNPANPIIDENPFLTDVNWQWFKIKYVDELSSKTLWYELMKIMMVCPTTKNISKKWLEQLQNGVQSMGHETYFKELQTLLSASFREDFWYFEDYRPVLKGFIWSCVFLSPTDTSLTIVKDIIEKSYLKIKGSGPKGSAVGNIGLDALLQLGNEQALGTLVRLRNKSKYPRLSNVLDKYIEQFKKKAPLDEDLLADKTVPHFDFKKGIKHLSVPPYRLELSIEDGKVQKTWKDSTGNVLKKLSPTDTTTPAVKEALSTCKQIQAVLNDLKPRLRTFWLHHRHWTGQNWQQYLFDNALMKAHIENLIWTNLTKKIDFIVRGSFLRTVEDEIHIMESNDTIVFLHPIRQSDSGLQQWQNYILKNKILQKEKQVFRKYYPFSSVELGQTETTRFAHHFLEVKKLRALANHAGWLFPYEQDGQNWLRKFIRELNVTAHLKCDYDRNDFAIPTQILFFTSEDTSNINSYNLQLSPIPFNTIPLQVLSEICRDIDLFIATAGITYNPALATQRPKSDGYPMEYSERLFSRKDQGEP